MKDKGQVEAERCIRYIQEKYPGRSLVQLLLVILKECGEKACRIAVDQIRRNQLDKLSKAGLEHLQRIENRLAGNPA